MINSYKKLVICICLSALISLFAEEANAVNILEIRVKRLYQEAQILVEKGDYDGAIEIYNKAILMAKDRDVKQFLINAKKEIQRKKRAEKGDFRIFRIEEEPEEMIFKPMMGGVPEEPEEKAGLEEERAQLEAERKKLEAERVIFEDEKREKELAEEKAPIEEERKRLEADKARFEEERSKAVATSSFEEERRHAEAERQKALKAFEETPERVMRKEEPVSEEKEPEEVFIAGQEAPDVDTESADLEERKEREARDRAIYESSFYRLEVKEILRNVQDKLKEASVKLEEEAAFKKTEAKLNDLLALDQQAEALVAEGNYEKAKRIYENIFSMSKDPDLKKYIKRQRQSNQ
ncbi:MAG: hypothetical protein V1883_04540 [Candidatus Omnitrophota bacterium]